MPARIYKRMTQESCFFLVNTILFSHLLMSHYMNSVVTRGSIDDCKLRLGKGHKRAKSRVRLDRGLLYRILVGDHVIFPRRSHLGSCRTHLCQESQCDHQGMVPFDKIRFVCSRLLSASHLVSLYYLSITSLL